MQPLSDDKVNDIISQLQNGHSVRQIAQHMHVGAATVSRIRSKYLSGMSYTVNGRPKKLSQRDVNHGIRLIMSGKADTATQVAKALQDITNQDLSAETVRRELKTAGMKASVKAKKPLLTKRHRRARLEWANLHKDWTLDDWKRVVWSDESKINRLGSDGRQWIWKKPGEGLSDRTVEETLKFGGGSLMVWGCMLWDGIGYLARIDGGLDADLYCEILNDELDKSLREYKKNPTDVIFQHDNDPKHTSKKAKNLLRNKPFEVMTWPSQSPDLNPIEHLWFHVKKRLASYETPPTSIHVLWTRVEVEWEKIEPSVCQGLIASMPKRVKTVLKSKGGFTKY
jgi:transposase